MIRKLIRWLRNDDEIDRLNAWLNKLTVEFNIHVNAHNDVLQWEQELS